ncbi:YcjF family protein [Loktanella salsilacus]|uniref:Putative membrane protein n=1 Tax=Loktanella salsilacus TaxID=195913 RepID=A0A1I4DU21_9RHOB|nr:TIGR01620 family protein [Loktanella salsilacus]SFK96553.1 putative membrane protein [Loktanella salsilacus]
MKRPVLIDLEEASDITPATAPIILDDAPQGAAMQKVAALAARRSSPLGKWFWSLLISIIGFMVSLAAWNFVTGLIASNPFLGMAFSALLIIFCCVLLAIALRELSAFSRLRRIDRVQVEAAKAHAGADLPMARKVVDHLTQLYAGRPDTTWGRQQLAERAPEIMDADGLLDLAERSLLEPLDARAVAEVQAAARQVAVVTAVVPLALADVFTALTSNLRMIRRIAEIYGGRSGTLGSLRLVRTVLTHLVATGAVAVGDDLIHSVAGGGLLSKVSRRFGEGVVNGALTARVGIAAIEVCRPLPFQALKRPSVTGTVQRALTGLFGSA